MATLQEWFQCDGLPIRRCNGYRVRHGLPPLPAPTSVLIDLYDIYRSSPGLRRFMLNDRVTDRKPAIGLGDTVQDILFLLRLEKRIHHFVVRRWGKCRCNERRRWLNRVLPYSARTWRRRWERAVSWMLSR